MRIWQGVHAITGSCWGVSVAIMLFDIATKGNLTREAIPAGVYDTRTTLWLVLLFTISAVSAVRALWIEMDRE